ncbi:MAG TPA: putative peptidoglycan glycosyltransferase FtsW [Spirochaetales bacterium]|nr:putative peptidoglycan glycosyltransferase FtsW [Spirochaetales bacterium]HPS14315.1 putative peptidoglycan glycosyltransferase FtsW [Spirochaetales bacterium]
MTRANGTQELRRKNSSKTDASNVVGIYCVLTVLGFVALWSGSSGYALRLGKSASYFAIRQAIFIGVSAVVFAITATFPLQKLRSSLSLLAFAAVGLLILTFVPGIGVEINGARRWINLRVTNFQPSEVWKPLIVAYVAYQLDKRENTLDSSPVEAIFPLLIAAMGSVIIYLQDDFSTAMVSLVAALIVFWLAGTSIWFFAGIAVVAIPAAFIMVASSEYRLTRIIGFIIPEFDPHGMNYQVQNSIRAIMSGGFWGEGIGLGTRKLSSIPEIQSDFIFAAFVEELGFLGVILVLACWVFFLVTVFRGTKERKGFSYTLPMGLAGLVIIEVLLNLGVVSGFLPATGIALPFFSAGGSSAIGTAISFGLIVNVLRNPGFEPVVEASGMGTKPKVHRPVVGGYAHG